MEKPYYNLKPPYTSFLNISIKVCLDVMLFAPITQNELLTEACTQLHLQALSKAISLGPQNNAL
jgi:hypothetical protein